MGERESEREREIERDFCAEFEKSILYVPILVFNFFTFYFRSGLFVTC